MKLRYLLFSLVLTLTCSVSAWAQSANDVGMICLNPYIPEAEGLGPKSVAMLTSKLQQIATVNGMSGSGFDNRFIITAHVQILKSTQTQSVPQKNAVEANIGIYVGDGLDGTLYSSYNQSVKGVGNSEDEAIASAAKKINPKEENLQSALSEGKARILYYYNKVSANILQTAKASASAGRYEEAINMLLVIPMGNKDFSTAQSLVAQYGSIFLDQRNLDVVRQARSAWSVDPTEDGAAAASEILKKLEAPSAKVQAEVKALQNEMTSRLKAVSDREYKLEVQREQNEKEVELASIRAATSVAKAVIANRPKVVYHYYWW